MVNIKYKHVKMTENNLFLDGGVNLVAKVNGKVVCDSKAIYGGISMNSGDQGTISAMEYCFGPIKVTKGDTMSLEAHYDLNLHPP
jgi:hypothetical protein